MKIYSVIASPDASGRQKQSFFGDTKKMIIRKHRNHKNTAILGLIIMFLFGFALSVSAHTSPIICTWTGSGADNLASNPYNWSGNMKPQNRDEVVFDSTSIKDCTWDLNVRIASLSIKSGYTGKVTKISGVTLTIAKDITWIGGGADNLASNPSNWTGNVVPQNGSDIVFDGTSTKDCIWDINVSPNSFTTNPAYTGTITLSSDLTITGNLTINGGTLNLNNKNLNVDGYILIGPSGTLNATSSTITLKGVWANYGSFNPGTSTVILNGTNQAIYGNTTFYNLIKTVTSADTLYFQAGSTQTILNSLTLQGAGSGLLALRSTQDGSYWYINPQGMRSVSLTDVKDSNNIHPTAIIPTNSLDSGNNNNIGFGGSECVCLTPLWQIGEMKRGLFWQG